MRFIGKAEEAANDILKLFQNPNDLPKPLAQVFIRRKDNVPCRAWSWRNQLLVAIHGYSDARGFNQWRLAGRYVQAGERAFYILSPLNYKRVDEETGEEKAGIWGFKGTPVFGYEQTIGDPLPVGDLEVDYWLESLPLLEVAERWGISVQGFNGQMARWLGRFQHRGPEGGAIAVGVTNLSTWAHELVHAGDHRNGKLKELGQHWKSETVVELGGAVLLRVLGYDHDADLGGCWEYIQSYAKKEETTVLDACNKVLTRTCGAVALILDTAEEIAREDRSSRPSPLSEPSSNWLAMNCCGCKPR
jgi:hypothetical protein